MRVAAFILLAYTSAAVATIVDGVAITAGTKVITMSEIALRIRLSAFENGEQPVFNASTRRTAAQQLIDQRLVEREMDIGRYPRLDSDRRKALVPDYATSFFQSDQAALKHALAERGLTPADLEEDLARQTDLLTFLSLRFRPEVQVEDPQLTNQRADAALEAWLREQRKRTRIEYLDKDLGQ